MTPKAFTKVRTAILEIEKPSTATFIFKQSKQNFKAIKLILSILVRKKVVICVDTNTDKFYYPLNRTKTAKTLERIRVEIEKRRDDKKNDNKTKKSLQRYD